MHRVPRHSGVLRFVGPESQKRRRLRRMGPAPRKAFPETRGTFEGAVPRRAATDNIQALSDLRFSCLVISFWRCLLLFRAPIRIAQCCSQPMDMAKSSASDLHWCEVSSYEAKFLVVYSFPVTLVGQ